METTVDFSATESNILGLKVGRCNSDLFDEVALYDQITAGEYDLCRVKVPAEDEMAPYRLNKTGLPFFFSGSIRRYKTKISEPPPGSYNFNDLVFEMYDGTQDQLLKLMLVGTWGTYPLGYYRTPYISDLVTKEKEIESVFQFYKKFNLKRDYPNNSIMFIKHGDEYVGFFALNIVGNNLESHIGGILEPYRKSGYFLDKLRYIKEFCIEHKLEHFVFGARNENAAVQRIFQYVGFQALGSENVFHIPSLLTFTIRPKIEEEFNITANDSGSLHQQLIAQCIHLSDHSPVTHGTISFHLHHTDLLLKLEKCKVQFSFPLLNGEESMVVMKFEPVKGVIPTGYFRISK